MTYFRASSMSYRICFPDGCGECVNENKCHPPCENGKESLLTSILVGAKKTLPVGKRDLAQLQHIKNRYGRITKKSILMGSGLTI